MPNFFEKIGVKKMFTDSVEAAQTKLKGAIGSKLVNDPKIQQQAKEGAFQKMGLWLGENYKLVLGGIVGLIVLAFAVGRVRK